MDSGIDLEQPVVWDSVADNGWYPATLAVADGGRVVDAIAPDRFEERRRAPALLQTDDEGIVLLERWGFGRVGSEAEGQRCEEEDCSATKQSDERLE